LKEEAEENKRKKDSIEKMTEKTGLTGKRER
jgi:hypothetical protein